jgi:dsRNA-specific ribonuclease
LVTTAQMAKAGRRRCSQANRIAFYHMDEVNPPIPPFQQLFFLFSVFAALANPKLVLIGPASTSIYTTSFRAILGALYPTF